MTAVNIAKKISQSSLTLVTLFASNILNGTVYSDTLIDQTALVVGKRVATVRDVELDDWLYRAIDQKKPVEFRRLRNQPEDFQKAQNAMLKRFVIRNYLVTTGLMPSAPAVQLERVKGSLVVAWGGKEGVAKALKDNDVTEETVDLLLTDRVMSDSFFSEHSPFRVTVTDAEVRAYYEKQKESRFLGKPFSQVMEIVKANLKKEKLEKEFDSWLQTEMRRTEVVVLPVKSG